MLKTKTIVLTTLFALAFFPVANASDQRGVIWSPSRVSDSAYQMRMGSRLPTRLETSAGTDVGFVGEDSRNGGVAPGSRVNFWGSVKLPAAKRKAVSTGAVVNMRMNPASGRRSLSFSNTGKWDITPEWAAEIQDNYSVDFDCCGTDKLNSRTSKSVRISSKTTGTSVVARGSRTGTDSHWHTNVGLEQRISGNLKLRANLNDLASDNGTQTLRAAYSHRW
ncbi:hypothetical protein ABFT80_11460 [Mesorhizobium sp. SB112]|uniref:hypothetical protein n=1 Tax=Mesorhizobium sp. SB112 TaxID=3151853 RepID=UPI003263C4B7